VLHDVPRPAAPAPAVTAGRSVRFLPEDALLAQCRTDIYRGSGSGGQKRNKTSNAVRLVHEPTGIAATATECRSLKENKLWAIRRLRIKLAAELREPIDLPHFSPPDWFLEIRHGNRIAASHRHAYYTPAAGLVLDLLAATHGNPAAVAANLGVSTTAVLKLLGAETAFWAAAAHIRTVEGMEPLTRRA
jgi:hypothetical protein